MAGDSAGVAGLAVTNRSDAKVFWVKDYIIGFTTSFRMGQVLRYGFNPERPALGLDKNQLYEHFVTTFIDEVRERFTETGFIHKENERESGGAFIVGYQDNLFVIEGDFQVGIPRKPYAAVGSGFDLALGALHATNDLDMDPKKRLRKSLDAAVEFNAGVRPPYVLLSNAPVQKRLKKK
jgi:ATP-dependent protease HslVU (ClpYQ) peptidase subunit